MKQGTWVMTSEDDEQLYCECGGIVDDDFFCTKCHECVTPEDEPLSDYRNSAESYIYGLEFEEDEE